MNDFEVRVLALLERNNSLLERIAAAVEPRSVSTARPTAPVDENGPRFRFGKSKGQLLARAELNEVRSAAHFIVRTLDDKPNYREANLKHLAELNAEIARRGSEPIEPEAPSMFEQPPARGAPLQRTSSSGGAPGEDDIPF